MLHTLTGSNKHRKNRFFSIPRPQAPKPARKHPETLPLYPPLFFELPRADSIGGGGRSTPRIHILPPPGKLEGVSAFFWIGRPCVFNSLKPQTRDKSCGLTASAVGAKPVGTNGGVKHYEASYKAAPLSAFPLLRSWSIQRPYYPPQLLHYLKLGGRVF